jgi:hypothetical protein
MVAISAAPPNTISIDTGSMNRENSLKNCILPPLADHPAKVCRIRQMLAGSWSPRWAAVRFAKLSA